MYSAGVQGHTRCKNGIRSFILFFFSCPLCNINCSCNGSTPLVVASFVQYNGNSFSSEGRDLMSNLGTIVGVPNSLLSESAPIIKLKRSALEVTNESDSGISNIAPIPMMLTLFMVDKLVEGNCIEFKVW